MLGLVLFTVSFIYYFRRNAWNSHNEINSEYRIKNKTLGDPKQTKGGLFAFENLKSKGKENEEKNDEKMIGMDLLGDIENAPDYPDDWDDEMQIPQLARSLQSHHDEIDKQLIDQNTLLNNLQEIFRKEVDDLKCLLSTSQEPVDNKNKSKKMIALLNELKNDVKNRKFYENNLDTSENKIDQLLRNLLRLLTQGPSVIADEIVEQISLQIFDKIMIENEVKKENDDEVEDADEYSIKKNTKNSEINVLKNTLCLSFTLQNLYNDLDEIKRYVNDTLIPSGKDETRRKELRESIFETNLNNILNESLSPIVLEQISLCRDQELGVDRASDGVNHVYSVFVQRTPKFVTAMNQGVEVRIIE